MRSNKIKAIILMLFFVALRSKATPSAHKVETETPTSTVFLKISQAPNPTIFLKSFLKWYKTKYEYLDHQIFPVNVDLKGNKPYRVNFKEAEKYLSVLKTSGFFSDAYITNYRAYFKSIDEQLKKSKQKDGPVDGLDYNPIVHSQEPESILENLDGLKFSVIKSTANYVTVKMTTKFDQNTYSLYTLKKNGNRFLIDKINFIIERIE